MKVLLGISGASGAVYGLRTGTALHSRGVELHMIVTRTAWDILDSEVGTGKATRAGKTRRSPPRSRNLSGRKRWLADRMSVPPGALSLYEEDESRPRSFRDARTSL
jgi:hypothetical protein